MGWAQKPTKLFIHIYNKVLWEQKYKTKYHMIYDQFLSPLYELIFCTSAPFMTDKALEIIQKIGDFYLMEHKNYIILYRATKAPHFIPRFVLK
jgi:hypothetical protein